MAGVQPLPFTPIQTPGTTPVTSVGQSDSKTGRSSFYYDQIKMMFNSELYTSVLTFVSKCTSIPFLHLSLT